MKIMLLILVAWIVVSVIAAPLVGAFIRAGHGPGPQDGGED